MKLNIDKWKKLAMSLAIVIVLNIFFNVGIDTFMNIPTYEEFCPQEIWNSQAACEDAGGAWTNEDGGTEDIKTRGWCNYDCWAKYAEERAPYDRNAFIILTALGVLTLVAGLYLAAPMAVTNGLLYGGVVSIIIGTMRYWSNMDDYLRFVVSGIALLLLVLVSFKKLKD